MWSTLWRICVACVEPVCLFGPLTCGVSPATRWPALIRLSRWSDGCRIYRSTHVPNSNKTLLKDEHTCHISFLYSEQSNMLFVYTLTTMWPTGSFKFSKRLSLFGFWFNWYFQILSLVQFYIGEALLKFFCSVLLEVCGVKYFRFLLSQLVVLFVQHSYWTLWTSRLASWFYV